MANATRLAWRHRSLRVLVLGEGVSLFGSLVARLAIPWAAATELRQGTSAVALLYVVQLVPFIVTGFFAGTLVDRWSRKRVLVTTNVLSALVTGSIPLAASLDRLEMRVLYITGALTGCISPFFRAAFRATIPTTVPTQELPAAQSLVQAVSSASEIGAFAAAGWLVHFFGGPLGIGIDALTFVWATGAAALLPATPPALAQSDRTGVVDELRAGQNFVRRHPVLRRMAISEFAGGLGGGVVGSVILVHITTTLGYPTGPQGVVFAVGGVTSLLAATVAPRVLDRIGLGRSLSLPLLLSVPATALAAFAPTPSPVGYAMLIGQQLVADPAQTVSMVGFGTVVGAATPDAMRGRVESAVLLLVAISETIGFLVGGFLGEPERIGTSNAMMVGALIVFLSAIRNSTEPLREFEPSPIWSRAHE